MDERVRRHQERFEQLRKIRTPHEKRMIDAIRYVYPYHMTMDYKNTTSEWQDDRYDTTATEAASMLADGLVGNLSPPSVKWFSFKAVENEANDISTVREWLQEVDERIIEALSRSNFYDIAPVVYRHAVTLETVAVMIDRDPLTGQVLFSVLPPKEVFVVNDAFGQVRSVYRYYALTAEQIKNAFGEGLPYRYGLEQAMDKSLDQEFFLITVVEKDSSDKVFPWKSITFEEDGDEILHEAKFRSNPIPVWRWEVKGRDPYGYGLTTDAMATIKTVNECMRTLLRMGHRIAEPPVFVPEEMADEIRMEPGSLNTFRDPGRRPYTFEQSQGLPFTDNLLEKLKEEIREKYKVKYFLMLMQMEQAGRTAYEIRERKIEKITAMGSIVGRCQQEFLGPSLNRVFWLEYEAGRIPDPPEELNSLMIEYVGPFAQAQKEVMETSGIMSGLTNAQAVFQLDPTVVKKIRYDKVLDQILKASGFPANAIRDEQEFQAVLAQEAAAQQGPPPGAAPLPVAGNPPIASEILGAMG